MAVKSLTSIVQAFWMRFSCTVPTGSSVSHPASLELSTVDRVFTFIIGYASVTNRLFALHHILAGHLNHPQKRIFDSAPPSATRIQNAAVDVISED